MYVFLLISIVLIKKFKQTILYDCSPQHDEGSPVAMTDYSSGKRLIGIVSFQPYICPISVGFPSRHTKVANYLEWITEVTGQLKNNNYSAHVS